MSKEVVMPDGMKYTVLDFDDKVVAVFPPEFEVGMKIRSKPFYENTITLTHEEVEKLKELLNAKLRAQFIEVAPTIDAYSPSGVDRLVEILITNGIVKREDWWDVQT